MTVVTLTKSFICRIVNNFYNHQFRIEVCRMKEAISRHAVYRLEEGEFDEARIRKYFQGLQRRGYSSAFIQAIFEQARAELESESENVESINQMNHV